MNRIATLGSRKFYRLHSLQGVLKLYIRMELKSMPVEILIWFPDLSIFTKVFSLGSSHRFYLYDGFCDMRKSFDGLCGLVSSALLWNGKLPAEKCSCFWTVAAGTWSYCTGKKGALCYTINVWKSGTFVAPHVKNGELSWSDLVLIVEGIQVVKSICIIRHIYTQNPVNNPT